MMDEKQWATNESWDDDMLSLERSLHEVPTSDSGAVDQEAEGNDQEAEGNDLSDVLEQTITTRLQQDTVDLSKCGGDIAVSAMIEILRKRGYSIKPPDKRTSSSAVQTATLPTFGSEKATPAPAFCNAAQSLPARKASKRASPANEPQIDESTTSLLSNLAALALPQEFEDERDVLDAVYTALKTALKESAHEYGRESSQVRSRSLEARIIRAVPECYRRLRVSTFKELLKKMQGEGYTVKYSQKRGEVFKVHLGWRESTEEHSSKTSSSGRTVQKVSGCGEDDVVKLVEAVESSLTSKGKAPACTVEKLLRSEIPDLYNRTPTIRCFSHYLMHMRSVGAPIRFEQAEGRPTWIYFL